MKLFKTAEPDTDKDSLLYQSRIAYICITQYLLHRGLLPTGVFEKRRMGGMFSTISPRCVLNVDLYLLSEKFVIHTFKNANQDGSVNRWGTKLSEMMRGMTEAIMRKYVSSLSCAGIRSCSLNRPV